MDDRFRPIYQRLFRNYAEEPPSGLPQFSSGRFPDDQGSEQRTLDEGYKTISASIAKIQARLDRQGLPLLREDAALLLLTCFSQMIYAPLMLDSQSAQGGAAGGALYFGGGQGFSIGGAPSLGDNNLSAIIEEDIWTIASTAARRNSPHTVSAHQILNTLPNLWDKLKAGASRLWEGR